MGDVLLSFRSMLKDSVKNEKCIFKKFVPVRSHHLNTRRYLFKPLSSVCRCKSQNRGSEDIYVRRTMEWINRVVIGYELCPFALQYLSGTRCVCLYDESPSLSKILQKVEEEAQLLAMYDGSKSSSTSTSLVVLPHGEHVDNFALFMEVITLGEKLLKDINLEDQVQIVPFHPLATFDAVTNEIADPADFTAKSPYPTIHLLLEEVVTSSLLKWNKAGKSSEDIMKRNKDILRKMGNQTLQKLFVDEILEFK